MRASFGDIAWIVAAIVIGGAALWIAFGSPVFSQSNASPSDFETKSP